MSITKTDLVGNTEKFTNTVKDFDQVTLIDPDSQQVIFYDPTGAVQATKTDADMVHVSLGVFSLYFTIPANGVPGTWHLDWTATKVGLPSRKRFMFDVTT
jgi:hypothetical protein